MSVIQNVSLEDQELFRKFILEEREKLSKKIMNGEDKFIYELIIECIQITENIIGTKSKGMGVFKKNISLYLINECTATIKKLPVIEHPKNAIDKLEKDVLEEKVIEVKDLISLSTEDISNIIDIFINVKQGKYDIDKIINTSVTTYDNCSKWCGLCTGLCKKKE